MDELTNGLSVEESALLEQVLEEAHAVLPTNSPTLLIDESTSRFSSATWFEEIQNQIVTLAGLGGIGSYVAFLLSRMKVKRMALYDDDRVEAANMSGQFYGMDDIGVTKLAAIGRALIRYSGYNSYTMINEKYSQISPATNVMICGFDNMEARKVFFENWKKHVLERIWEERENCLFIDGRLAAEEFQVFCIKGTDTFLMQKYEENWLFDDTEAEQTLCSYKQTTFCANMIASVMVNLFVNFVANKCNPLIERELPFYTYYDAGNMLFKTETV